MNDLTDLKTFAKRYAEAWCSQNPGSVAALFAENGSLSVNDGLPAVGRAAIAENARGFMSTCPDMVATMNDLTHDSDGTKFHWTSAATNFGNLITPDSSQNRKAISTAGSTNASLSTESMALATSSVESLPPSPRRVRVAAATGYVVRRFCQIQSDRHEVA